MTKTTCSLLFALVLLQGCGNEDTSAPATVATPTPTPAVTITDTPTPVVATTTAPAAVLDTAPAAVLDTAPAAVLDTAPAAVLDTMFQDLQGNPLELSAYAGRKVFLNYWATWCAPCIREIPSITRATAELEDENYVFLLASDESIDKINDFLLDRDFTGNFIKLNGFFGAHGIHAVPSSSLYDETGALVITWNGAFEWDSPEMLDAIRNGTPVALETGRQ